MCLSVVSGGLYSSYSLKLAIVCDSFTGLLTSLTSANAYVSTKQASVRLLL
jgi:hypothetical protein